MKRQMPVHAKHATPRCFGRLSAMYGLATVTAAISLVAALPGQRGYSLDRPVYPLIGCTSRDGKYLAAIAWPETRSLGQVWHDCLHPRPAIGESYDAETSRIVSRGRIYFLPNDETTLLEAFRRDFPDWRRPRPH